MAWGKKLFCSLVVTDRSSGTGSATVPSAGWKGREKFMWGLGGVFHNGGCLTDTACGVNIWDGGESDSDLFSHPYHLLQLLTVQSGAVSEPGSDAANQEALYSPPLESGENGGWEVGFPQPSQEMETLLGLLHSGAGV